MAAGTQVLGMIQEMAASGLDVGIRHVPVLGFLCTVYWRERAATGAATRRDETHTSAARTVTGAVEQAHAAAVLKGWVLGTAVPNRFLPPQWRPTGAAGGAPPPPVAPAPDSGRGTAGWVSRQRDDALAALDFARRWFDHEPGITYSEAANRVRRGLGLTETHEEAADRRGAPAGRQVQPVG